MNTIDLCSILEPFLGLIVPCSSGVAWTNQTGGISCLHPHVEGIYIPLPVKWLPRVDPLINSGGSYDEEATALFLEGSEQLSRYFEAAPQADGPPGYDYGEAWVLVRIRLVDEKSFFFKSLKPFEGQMAILTYLNSD